MTPTQTTLVRPGTCVVWIDRPNQTAQDVPLCINVSMDGVGGVHRSPPPIGSDRLARGEVAVGSTDGEKNEIRHVEPGTNSTWTALLFGGPAKTWHRGINATKEEPSFAHLLRDFTAIVAPSFSGGGHGGKYCCEGCDAG